MSPLSIFFLCVDLHEPKHTTLWSTNTFFQGTSKQIQHPKDDTKIDPGGAGQSRLTFHSIHVLASHKRGQSCSFSSLRCRAFSLSHRCRKFHRLLYLRHLWFLVTCFYRSYIFLPYLFSFVAFKSSLIPWLTFCLSCSIAVYQGPGCNRKRPPRPDHRKSNPHHRHLKFGSAGVFAVRTQSSSGNSKILLDHTTQNL